jgi:hypothetical protein
LSFAKGKGSGWLPRVVNRDVSCNADIQQQVTTWKHQSVNQSISQTVEKSSNEDPVILIYPVKTPSRLVTQRFMKVSINHQKEDPQAFAASDGKQKGTPLYA